MKKIIKKLIAKIKAKKQAKKKDVEKKCEIELLNEMERIFDKYNENIIFKVHIGDDCEYIDIYSKNYKIGLEKPKKKEKPKETEEQNNDN